MSDNQGTRKSRVRITFSRRALLSSLGSLTLLVAACQVSLPGSLGRPVGGSSAPVAGLAVDPGDGSLIKVGGSVFRTTDHGQSWEPLPIAATLNPDKLGVIAINPKAPSSLYAAGPGAGVIRSDDRGQTWRVISSTLPSQDVTAFAVHSFRPDTLYAGIVGHGVFRTEDGGGRWQRMDGGPSARVVGLAHSTLDGSMNTGWLYAATPDGPYLSMDCF